MKVLLLEPDVNEQAIRFILSNEKSPVTLEVKNEKFPANIEFLNVIYANVGPLSRA